jgi:hypothetical protein
MTTVMENLRFLEKIMETFCQFAVYKYLIICLIK